MSSNAPTDTTLDSPFEPALQGFLTSKGKGDRQQSGTYRRNLERDVRRFFGWLADQPDAPTTFTALSPVHLRQYICHLIRDEDLAESSIRTYYANLSAFLGWCVREGYLTENPAQTKRAKEPLPATDHDNGRQRDTDQQTWSTEQRHAICQHVDRATEQAFDAVKDGHGRWDTIKAARDRAFVYVLAYAGIRGRELLRNQSDERRTGVTWNDLDLEERRLTVFSKKQELSDRSLPDSVLHLFGQIKGVLKSEESWPIFPTLHRPTLYTLLREAFTKQGVPDEEIERRLDEERTFALFHTADITPPSITTESGRRIMKQLATAAEIDVDETFSQNRKTAGGFKSLRPHILPLVGLYRRDSNRF